MNRDDGFLNIPASCLSIALSVKQEKWRKHKQDSTFLWFLKHRPPEEFGRYLAVGSHNRSSGAAICFEVDSDFISDFFNMGFVPERCVPHADGSPKHSFYLGICRVLEHIPLEALRYALIGGDRSEHKP